MAGHIINCLRFILSKNKSVSKINDYQIRNLCYKQLIFYDFGDPSKCVTLERGDLPPPCHDEVVVQMIQAPVYQQDINAIRGIGSVKPKLPAVPGHDGVGKIVAVGQDISQFEIGDIVIPNTKCFGTWRSHGLFKPEHIYKVQRKVDYAGLATMCNHMASAYRLLKDFVPLKSNDVVIQNEANGNIGIALIQMSKLWKFRSVNVVQDRPDLERMRKHLTSLGATHVISEEELRKDEVFKHGEVPPPRLGLNCIGSKCLKDMVKKMADCSVMVTYGGISRIPKLECQTPNTFHSVKMQGFWMNTWHEENRFTEERKMMMSDLQCFIKEKSVTVPKHTCIPLENYHMALCDPEATPGLKYMFTF